MTSLQRMAAKASASVLVVAIGVSGGFAQRQARCAIASAHPQVHLDPEGDSVPPTPPASSIQSMIPPPSGYERMPVDPMSFGAWLRRLPLRPGRPAVHLFDGRKKANQTAHHAVLDVDIGDRNLQQCADAVIRLRAEYLFAGTCRNEIRFCFTSGDTAWWKEWRRGIRPLVDASSVSWRHTAAADQSYQNFRDYLDTIFMYAGSASLERELAPVTEPTRMEVGDVFIQGGFPGHAVLVVDVAEDEGGERVFLLAQSYMPAQDIHILRSFEDVTPWYRAQADGVLRTPEWDFHYVDLKRFRRTSCETDRGQTPN